MVSSSRPSGRSYRWLTDIDTSEGANAIDRQRSILRQVMSSSLAAEYRDDRFEHDELASTGVVEFDADQPTGFLGGSITAGTLNLDGLLADPQTGSGQRATSLWANLAAQLPSNVGAVTTEGQALGQLELWGKPALPWHQQLAHDLDLTPHRSLNQLRCRLPVVADPIPTRPFRTGHDDQALLQVNNRAFASHPDQGGLTLAELQDTFNQPWFNPDGLRVADDPRHPDRLLGFCWTKIHPPATPQATAIGEIYVIGIDPDHHGRGLGVPMTAAGLHWLAEQGLTGGMLYVEADNEPAMATYRKLGFSLHRQDRSWLGAIPSSNSR